MKGILLAGGAGTRLYPVTSYTSKQLLTIYDKPMIYYPLSILMIAGIKDILLISTQRDLLLYKSLLGTGEHLGLSIDYLVQEEPIGIAHAFLLAESFINQEPVCLVLGDNVLYGSGLPLRLRENTKLIDGAIVFGYWVSNPERYGVIEYSEDGKVKTLEEKPKYPKSNYAVPGIYFYDKNVTDYAKELKPSMRGELEITDINKIYLQKKRLRVDLLGRGIAWLDTGTPDSLLDAANFVATIDRRQGLKIACIEEIAYRMGYINEEMLENIMVPMPESDYKNYIKKILFQHVDQDKILIT
ncbi:glucose-1-phosphate thymidylyltransferase RfbA [Fictibacillus phosphorivorans]|uniref:glucose-1-phosphate thymidylyltransferase RfbA n=1 Tax=Fictibacillus phosphorivorans TaxID=1221500 RepID=UPI003CEF3C8F